jgi:hypothetical protein
MEADNASRHVPIRDLVKDFLRLGVLGFGGPVALVGQMERELVGDKKWLTIRARKRFDEGHSPAYTPSPARVLIGRTPFAGTGP